MEFDNLPRSKPVPRRTKKHPVFCVGWKAFVHWPPRDGHSPTPVPMVDSAGALLANDLADGQEVEIVSWRPRSREGLQYQIRRISDNTEWWIGAVYLRRQRDASSVPSPLTELTPR